MYIYLYMLIYVCILNYYICINTYITLILFKHKVFRVQYVRHFGYMLKYISIWINLLFSQIGKPLKNVSE